MTKKYHDYLQSPQWAAKRNKIYNRSRAENGGDLVCQRCCSRRGPFDVHHLTYARLYDEYPSDLILACRHCHASLHECRNRLQKPEMKEEFSWEEVERFLGIGK